LRSQRWRIRLLRAIQRIGLEGEYFLILVSIVIGAATGLFAHLFYNLIEYARELAYGFGDHPGLYGGHVWMLVILPAVGALAVGYITHYFAREAKGHGVPEVMDAMCRRGSVIRPRVAGAKALASALTIGSGGSAGAEGPIVQIGAAVGSGIGQVLGIPRRQMDIVVACGVAAGIAAIFNAPIAGVLFALEIFLKDFSFRAFSPVVFSSVISCSITHAFRLEDEAIFEVRALRETGYVFVGKELPLFLLLGVICAFVAFAFIRSLYFSEDLAERLKMPETLKPVAGAALLGLAGAAFVLVQGDPQMPPFFGNGYPAIEAALSNAVLTMTIGGLGALFVLKLLATCLTLGSGGSGGIFAPSLMLGATLGAAFGLTLRSAGLIADTSVHAYALVGMGAVVAGTTHAPLTAIVMLYEITREPKVILPVMFAAIVATAGARLLHRDSIYTLKLRRRGVRIGSLTDLTILRRITVADVGLQPAQLVHADDPLQKLIDLAGQTDATDFVVVDNDDAYQGMVTGRDVRTALLQPEAVSLLVVGELVRPNVPTVESQETLDVVLDKFARSDVDSLAIEDSERDQHGRPKPQNGVFNARILGLITRHAVMRRYHAELER